MMLVSNDHNRREIAPGTIKEAAMTAAGVKALITAAHGGVARVNLVAAHLLVAATNPQNLMMSCAKGVISSIK